jgi:hypothetical protein
MLLIGIGAVIVLGIIVYIIRRAIGYPDNSPTPGSKKYGFFDFRRLAASYGLDKDQRKLLDSIFRASGVGDPARVLRNPELLDRHFERAFKTIERDSESEDEAQRRKMQLFSLRNAIESAPGDDSGILSTHQIAVNTPAVLATGKDTFTVRVISNKEESLVIEFPKNSLGSMVRIAKGSKVSLSFFTTPSKGFAFASKVLGNVNTPHGPALELTHSVTPKPLTQRRYRRRKLSANCTFNKVLLDGTKSSKKSAKFILDPHRYIGTLLDISAGGCSIKTPTLIQAGTRLKIEVAYDEESRITVLGQVLRVNRSAGVGIVLNIKFLKVPRKASNNINSLVYGYED